MRRIILTGVVLVGMAVLFAIFAIHVQQRLFQHRAERLLLDVRNLELRKSTWTDAQGFIKRWGGWGKYKETCTSAKCSYEVELDDLMMSALMNHSRAAKRSEWLIKAYSLLGCHPVRITADLRVFNGIVWGKGYAVFINVPPEGGPDAPFGGHGYTLIGSATSLSSFKPAGYWPQLLDHSEYVVGTPGGCTGCLAVYARFTPYASPRDIERMMDFNLACITRIQPCKEKGEIMPAAWREYLSESDKREVSWSPLEQCEYPVHLLARDTENAVVAEVVENRMERHVEPYQVSRMRLVSRLKGAEFWQTNTDRDVRLFDGEVSRTTRNLPQHVSPGRRFILLFAHAKDGIVIGPDVWLDKCGCIPATEENLIETQAGIARDFQWKQDARQETP